MSIGYIDSDWPEGGCTCEGFNARKTCRHWRLCLELEGVSGLAELAN